MQPNAWLGQVPLRVAGRELNLQLTWAAHDRLLELLGEDYGTGGKLRDLSVLVHELSGGSISAEAVYEASPPIRLTMAAVQRAIVLGWVGPEGAGEEAGEEAAGPFLRRLAKGFAGFFSGRWRRVSAMTGSGA
jgi:hypothetical protein